MRSAWRRAAVASADSLNDEALALALVVGVGVWVGVGVGNDALGDGSTGDEGETEEAPNGLPPAPLDDGLSVTEDDVDVDGEPNGLPGPGLGPAPALALAPALTLSVRSLRLVPCPCACPCPCSGGVVASPASLPKGLLLLPRLVLLVVWSLPLPVPVARTLR